MIIYKLDHDDNTISSQILSTHGSTIDDEDECLVFLFFNSTSIIISII